MSIQRDAWLSEVMARSVFRVDGVTEIPDEPGFYFAKVPTDRVADVGALTRRGFAVVDTNVTFERVREVAIATDVDVSDCTADDADGVLAIAGAAFRYSRFHLDPAIGVALANHVKREWVANYVRRVRGDALFVARVDGRPAGFLAALVAHGTAVIDLVAVAPSAHGKGIGSALCDAFAKRYAGQPRIVGTQIANVPSIRMYTKLGYELARSAYVLHRHVDVA